MSVENTSPWSTRLRPNRAHFHFLQTAPYFLSVSGSAAFAVGVLCSTFARHASVPLSVHVRAVKRSSDVIMEMHKQFYECETGSEEPAGRNTNAHQRLAGLMLEQIFTFNL